MGCSPRFLDYVLVSLGGFTEFPLYLLQLGEAGKPRMIFLDSLAAKVLDADPSLPLGGATGGFGKLI